ncbi:MAG: hypothetical protein FVQ77_09700 [Cytophagales bacterium]|nr:hypothetical protein [Cytophagales bacterium]
MNSENNIYDVVLLIIAFVAIEYVELEPAVGFWLKVILGILALAKTADVIVRTYYTIKNKGK